MQEIDQETKDDVSLDEEEVQEDLALIKSILVQFNKLCESRRSEFTTAKVPIDDNKWMHYLQYPTPDFTTCECFLGLLFLFN